MGSSSSNAPASPAFTRSNKTVSSPMPHSDENFFFTNVRAVRRNAYFTVTVDFRAIGQHSTCIGKPRQLEGGAPTLRDADPKNPARRSPGSPWNCTALTEPLRCGEMSQDFAIVHARFPDEPQFSHRGKAARDQIQGQSEDERLYPGDEPRPLFCFAVDDPILSRSPPKWRLLCGASLV